MRNKSGDHSGSQASFAASFLFFLLVFIALVRPEIEVGPAPRILGDGFVWVAVIAVHVFLVLLVRKRGTLRTDIWVLLIAAAAVWVYFLLVFLLYGAVDTEMLRRTASLPVSAVVGYSLAYLWLQRSGPKLDLGFMGRLMLLAAAINSIVIVAQISIPFVETLLSAIIPDPIRNDGPSYLYRSGLRSVGGDALSLNQAALIIVGVVLSREYRGWKNSVITLILAAAAMPATFLSGRVGAYFLGAFLVVFVLFWISTAIARMSVKMKMDISFLGWLFLIIGTLCVIAVIIVTSSVTMSSVPGVSRLMRPGETLMTLMGSHLDWSHLPDAVLWGTGHYGRSSSLYLASDIGWIRVLHGAGILGTLVLLLPFVVALVITVLRVGHARLALSGVLVLSVMFLGHLKLVYIPTIIISNLFFLVVFLNILARRQRQYS